VDIQPTRGLNKTTGSEKVGADVQRERHNEQMAEIMRPIFGENPEQRATRHRRSSLRPEDRRQCDRLDRDIAAAESEEAKTTNVERSPVQAKLLRLRKMHKGLKC
jgi:hypothetical protein